MKQRISVCIIIFALVIFAVAAGRTSRPDTENDGKLRVPAESESSERTIEVSSDPVPYAYILREHDGRVVVYRAESNEIYMETGIMVICLPDEVAAALQGGIGVKDEMELFDFLENYSS